MSTIETLLTQAYDLEQAGQLAEAARLRTMARDAGSSWTGALAIGVEQLITEDGKVYTDFTAGDGLTKVLIGEYHDKPGIELIIGGNCINEDLNEVITLADVRQLRDNLTALLDDARLTAAALDEPSPEPPCAPTVQIKCGGMEDSHWTDFSCGAVSVVVADALDEEIAIYGLGGDQQPIADAQRNISHLNAILDDPRFQAARVRHEAGAPPIFNPPAVRVVPHICDDKIDPRCGTVTWVDYIVDTPAGAVEVSISDRRPPQLDTDEHDLGELAEWVVLVPAITTLLNHPEVKAALAKAA